jgi:hypothetical protein
MRLGPTSCYWESAAVQRVYACDKRIIVKYIIPESYRCETRIEGQKRGPNIPKVDFGLRYQSEVGLLSCCLYPKRAVLIRGNKSVWGVRYK